MSLLNHLAFQTIDSSIDDIPAEHRPEDDINLNEQIDDGSLESFWNEVVNDIREDPDWFKFADE